MFALTRESGKNFSAESTSGGTTTGETRFEVGNELLQQSEKYVDKCASEVGNITGIDNNEGSFLLSSCTFW